MKNRIIALLLSLAMLVTMLPVTTFAANNGTVTVVDQNGSAVTLSEEYITVTRKTYYGSSSSNVSFSISGNTVSYTRSGSTSTLRGYTYTVTISVPGYEAQTVSISGSTTRTTVTLMADGPEFATFDLFYYIGSETNTFPPNGYAASGDVSNYGPSGNDTPFTQLTVNITALRERTDAALYEEGKNGNDWHFIPLVKNNTASAKAFWTAVLDCATEESLEALEATGMYNDFVGYCLKDQGSGDCHGDGILAENPPAYVVELHKDGVYQGGSITGIDGDFPTMEQELEALEGYLGYNITWEEDESGVPIQYKKADGTPYYTGTYIEGTSLYTITVTQKNWSATNVLGGENRDQADIYYEKVGDYYYLAQFEITTSRIVETITYVVTYTDGVANEELFYDHEYGVNINETVPAFTGNAYREDYIFRGWLLLSNGQVYTDEQLSTMVVTSDMTLQAVWQAVPRYAGMVEVILDGTYDSTTGTATGTRVDITQVMGAGVSLYVHPSGKDTHLPLEKTGTGIYSAELKNGEYGICYYNAATDSFTHSGDQLLTIENQDRVRYLFFNTVTYDANGGTNAPAQQIYASGSAATVSVVQPTREGYLFTGWECDDTVYHGGDTLVDAIYLPRTLTAQWQKAQDVYVTIKIDHVADENHINSDRVRHDIAFTLDSRPSGSAGDFTEIYTHSMVWGENATEYQDAYFLGELISQDAAEYTQYTLYTPTRATLSNVAADMEYTFTTHKSGYVIESISQSTDENGDLQIVVTLVYDPDSFDLLYTVRLHEDALSLPDRYKPVAVNVKVTCWYDFPLDQLDQVNWDPIVAHYQTYERIALDPQSWSGSGTYPVAIGTTDGLANYHYRIEVVSYELADGTILNAFDENGDNKTFVSEGKRYYAVVTAEGGAVPNGSSLPGVWYDATAPAQQGTLEAVVSIPVFTVTYDPNGGTLNGSQSFTVAEGLLLVPEESRYVPVREGGYVFAGWYLADEMGNMTETLAPYGTDLTGDITLIAKWNEPLTVEGLVTVAGSYEQENADGSVSIQHIYADERAVTAMVLLQKIDPNGYTETVREQAITLDYSNGEYYHTDALGIRYVGFGTYCFTQLPNDGTQYRIQLLIPNFTSTFQNEPESLENGKSYPTYTLTDYAAVWGNTDANTANVNIHAHFAPESFTLEFRVDADAISQAFRPQSAQVLITYKEDMTQMYPSQWPVISQMAFDDAVVGQTVALSEGLGSGSVSVWKYMPDGATITDYGLRLQSTTNGSVTMPYSQDNPYCEVSYQSPAHYTAQGQSQELIVTITPKVYAVNYVLDGGQILGTHPHSHTWSYATSLEGIAPIRNGYVFQGWYTDSAFTQEAPAAIDASVAEEVTLYAKWLQVMDTVHMEVVIDHQDHNSDTGLASNYNKVLQVQLTRKPRDSEEAFVPVTGQTKAYDNSYWHVSGDGVEQDGIEVYNIFYGLSEAYDYSLDVTLPGYFQESKTVEKRENPDGSTTHYVKVVLRFDPTVLDMQFSVEMKDTVDAAFYPESANVRVTCWYDAPGDDLGKQWFAITQHRESVIPVLIDPQTGVGEGTCGVWHWEDEENLYPYYYRIEVVSLRFADGTEVELAEQNGDDTNYAGGGWLATVVTDQDCAVPDGATLEGVYSADTENFPVQTGAVKAVIDMAQVEFYTDNALANGGEELFRTYYPAGADVDFTLNADGTLPQFYDLPEFSYEDHNGYIFRGWYLEDGTPLDWTTVYEIGTTKLYARWIETGTVDQERDGKVLPESWNGIYQGYDLTGIQLRAAKIDPEEHYGTVGAGLRFITAMKETVWGQINALSGDAEYGFVMAKRSAVESQTGYDSDYRLEYKAKNVNGVDTTSAYSYVINLKCSGVKDHFNGENYRLYTGVITYNSVANDPDRLEAAQAQEMVVRSYIRYYDANGLLRTYYNNYTGTQVAGGCSASYNMALDLLQGE